MAYECPNKGKTDGPDKEPSEEKAIVPMSIIHHGAGIIFPGMEVAAEGNGQDL